MRWFVNGIIEMGWNDNSYKADIDNHSGSMWMCVGKRMAPYGGYLYQFIPKEEYDNFFPCPDLLLHSENYTKKRSEIFPAVEDGCDFLAKQNCEDGEIVDFEVDRHFIVEGNAYVDKFLQSHNIGEEEQEFRKKITDVYKSNIKEQACKKWSQCQDERVFLKLIGYRMFLNEAKQLIYELPDIEALQQGWKQAQKTYKTMDLPDLDVIDSNGIADDSSFAKAYMEHSALLSNGKEFFHDHTLHIQPIISSMIDGKYQILREKMVNILKDLFEKIEKREETANKINNENTILNKEKLYFTLGMIADTLSNLHSDPSKFEKSIFDWNEFVNGRVTDNLREVGWEGYIKKRFGPETSLQSIADLWMKLAKDD